MDLTPLLTWSTTLVTNSMFWLIWYIWTWTFSISRGSVLMFGLFNNLPDASNCDSMLASRLRTGATAGGRNPGGWVIRAPYGVE